MNIKFVQYLRPDGRTRMIEVDRPDDIYLLAAEVVAAGGVFTAEELMTGTISVACEHGDADIAIELSPNGPGVNEAVDRLVKKAHEILKGGE